MKSVQENVHLYDRFAVSIWQFWVTNQTVWFQFGQLLITLKQFETQFEPQTNITSLELIILTICEKYAIT